MVKPTLVVMAAGMGSRYGGLKQIEPVGPNGEIIMEYSVYDAREAGFGKAVFIIKREIEDIFKEMVGEKIAAVMPVEYVYQNISDVPAGISVPPDREKPWGTGHAVMCTKGIVNEPFAVINADDYYGKHAFKIMYDFLTKPQPEDGTRHYALAGYQVENTLTENGHVTRGVCDVDKNGILTGINERLRVQKFGAETKYSDNGENWVTIPPKTTVSMNFWGFTPDIIDILHERFPAFVEASQSNILKAEYFLPVVADGLVKENIADVKVLTSHDKWYGVTYKEDRQGVVDALKSMTDKGLYPKELWT